LLYFCGEPVRSLVVVEKSVMLRVESASSATFVSGDRTSSFIATAEISRSVVYKGLRSSYLAGYSYKAGKYDLSKYF
jgi:hypothetical protein